jgi:hypothetical protein
MSRRGGSGLVCRHFTCTTIEKHVSGGRSGEANREPARAKCPRCENVPKMHRPDFRGLTGCEYVPITGKIGEYSHFDLRGPDSGRLKRLPTARWTTSLFSSSVASHERLCPRAALFRPHPKSGDTEAWRGRVGAASDPGSTSATRTPVRGYMIYGRTGPSNPRSRQHSCLGLGQHTVYNGLHAPRSMLPCAALLLCCFAARPATKRAICQ